MFATSGSVLPRFFSFVTVVACMLTHINGLPFFLPFIALTGERT